MREPVREPTSASPTVPLAMTAMKARLWFADARSVLVELAVASGLGVLLALLGPFGTFAMASAAERILYWVALLLVAWLLYQPVWRASGPLAARLDLPAGLIAGGLLFLMSLPMTAIVWLASFRHTPTPLPGPLQFVEMFGKVSLIAALLSTLCWMVERRRSIGSSPPVQAEPQARADLAPEPPFMSAVPHHLRGRLIALEMEDHYLRVHTDRGSALILLRIRDAVAQLPPEAGAQVHRSWWVARSAVREICRDGKKLSLLLENDLRLPVSRERVAELRRAGFF